MKYRDLTILPMCQGKSMVIACDVSASIGEKEYDTFKIPLRITSAFTLRVVLFELLAYGVEPKVIISLVGNDMETIGKPFLNALRDELDKAHLLDVEINGSTEENMLAKTTSIGITGIAYVDNKDMRGKVLHDGDLLYCLGKPYVGEYALKNIDALPTYDDIRKLHTIEGVVDILPIGSKGIIFESAEMGRTSGLYCELLDEYKNSNFIKQSAGPATAVLIGVKKGYEEKLLCEFTTAQKLGKFINFPLEV